MEKNFLIILLLVLIGLCSSCSEQLESFNLQISGTSATYYYKNGDTATFVPDISTMPDSVVFYVDSVKVATETVAPFICRYAIDSMTVGTHSLQINTYIRIDKNVYRTIYSYKTLKIVQ